MISLQSRLQLSLKGTIWIPYCLVSDEFDERLSPWVFGFGIRDWIRLGEGIVLNPPQNRNPPNCLEVALICKTFCVDKLTRHHSVESKLIY